MWPFKSKSKPARLTEDTASQVIGPRFPVEQLATFRYNGAAAGFFVGRDLYPWKSNTIRTLWDHDIQRYLGRNLYESNCNAKGVLNGLSGYVVGRGFTFKVVDREDEGEPGQFSEQTEPPHSEKPGVDESDPASSPAPEPSPLAKKVRKLLADFCETAKVSGRDGWHAEGFMRWHRDGEFFLRLFPQVDGPTLARCVEPDMVRPPLDQSLEGPWAFGILTDPEDLDTPKAYNIIYPGEKHVRVDAERIFHLKNNVSRNVRRGLSTYWSCSDELYGTSKLRYTSREGEKVRQAIAYIRQHALADKNSIVNLQAGTVTQTQQRWDADGVMRDVPMERSEPGSVVDIPKGLDYKPGPAAETGSQDGAKIAEDQGLAAVAANWVVCTFLVTGQGDSGTYASAVVAESPMLNTVLAQQEVHTTFWRAVYKAVVQIEIDKGALPEDTFEQVDIHLVAPNPSRNKKEAVESDKILADAGLLSDDTFATRHNLDLEEEQAKGAEKSALPEPVSPGGTPQTPSGQRNKETDPPRANPRKE